MLSYTQRTLRFEEALGAWAAASAFVAAVPKHLQPDGEEIRCHELARAVAKALTRPDRFLWAGAQRLVVEDGRFCPWPTGPAIEHSWIEISDKGKLKFALLDVYAIGRMPQVQLIDGASGLHRLTASYYLGPKRDDIRHDVVEWLLTFDK